MLAQDTYNDAHVQFGIDEVYILDGLDLSILKKLQQRAEATLDCTNVIVQKNVVYDMIFIYHKRVTSTSLIYRFLEFLHKNPSKQQDFKKSYTLLNKEELFEAIKEKKFVLVTCRDVSSDNC